MITQWTDIGDGFKTHIEIQPAFDKRDPNPSKDYGIGSVKIRFVLRGEKGAVIFSCSTGMYLPQQVKEHGHDEWKKWQPMGYGVWYCTTTPIEGVEPRKNCENLDGKDCYGDGSCLASDEVMPILISEGSEGLWKKLKEYYNDWL